MREKLDFFPKYFSLSIASKSWPSAVWSSRRSFEWKAGAAHYVLRLRKLRSFTTFAIKDLQQIIDTLIQSNARTLRELTCPWELLDLVRARHPNTFSILSSANGVSHLQFRLSRTVDETIFGHFAHLSSLRIQRLGNHINLSTLLPYIVSSCVNVKRLALDSLKATPQDLALLSGLKQLKCIGLSGIIHPEYEKLAKFCLEYESLATDSEQTPESALQSFCAVGRLLPPSIGLNLHIMSSYTYMHIVSMVSTKLTREMWLGIVKDFRIDLSESVLDSDEPLAYVLFSLYDKTNHRHSDAFLWALQEDLIDLRRFNVFSFLKRIQSTISEPIAEWLVTEYLERAAIRYELPPSCLLMTPQRETVLMGMISTSLCDLAEPAIKRTFDSLLDRGILSVNDVDVEGNTLAHYAVKSCRWGQPSSLVRNMEILCQRGLDLNQRNNAGQKFFHLAPGALSTFPKLAIETLGLKVTPEDLDIDGYISTVITHSNTTLLESLLPFAAPSNFQQEDDTQISSFMHACSFYSTGAAKLLISHRDRLELNLNQVVHAPPGYIETSKNPHLRPLKRFGYTVTPLVVSVACGREEVVEALLQAGADVTRIYDDGNNIFHIACIQSFAHSLIPMMLRYLSPERANLVVQKNDSGLSPMEILWASSQKSHDADAVGDDDTDLSMAIRSLASFCKEHSVG